MTYFCTVPSQKPYPTSDSIADADTIYGIENEELIPIRQTETVPQKESLTQELFDPSPLVTGTASWQIIMLLLAVLMLGVVKAFSNNRYRLGLKALFNYSVAKEITREELVFFHRSNIFLTIAHTITFSLFIYQIKNDLLGVTDKTADFNDFLIIVAGIVLIYSSK